jgi:hypothetical protein
MQWVRIFPRMARRSGHCGVWPSDGRGGSGLLKTRASRFCSYAASGQISANSTRGRMTGGKLP